MMRIWMFLLVPRFAQSLQTSSTCQLLSAQQRFTRVQSDQNTDERKYLRANARSIFKLWRVSCFLVKGNAHTCTQSPTSWLSRATLFSLEAISNTISTAGTASSAACSTALGLLSEGIWPYKSPTFSHFLWDNWGFGILSPKCSSSNGSANDSDLPVPAVFQISFIPPSWLGFRHAIFFPDDVISLIWGGIDTCNLGDIWSRDEQCGTSQQNRVFSPRLVSSEACCTQHHTYCCYGQCRFHAISSSSRTSRWEIRVHPAKNLTSAIYICCGVKEIAIHSVLYDRRFEWMNEMFAGTLCYCMDQLFCSAPGLYFLRLLPSPSLLTMPRVFQRARSLVKNRGFVCFVRKVPLDYTADNGDMILTVPCADSKKVTAILAWNCGLKHAHGIVLPFERYKSILHIISYFPVPVESLGLAALL